MVLEKDRVYELRTELADLNENNLLNLMVIRSSSFN